MNSIRLPRALTLLVYLLTIVVYQFITTELLAFHHRLILKRGIHIKVMLVFI